MNNKNPPKVYGWLSVLALLAMMALPGGNAETRAATVTVDDFGTHVEGGPEDLLNLGDLNSSARCWQNATAWCAQCAQWAVEFCEGCVGRAFDCGIVDGAVGGSCHCSATCTGCVSTGERFRREIL